MKASADLEANINIRGRDSAIHHDPNECGAARGRRCCDRCINRRRTILPHLMKFKKNRKKLKYFLKEIIYKEKIYITLYKLLYYI